MTQAPAFTAPDHAAGHRFWLSVLVPVYQVEAYLEECLQSILDQADPGVEVVICDDCSPDGSAAIAQQFVARYPQQVRMIRHEANRGLSAARNSLLEASHGDYVWFLDSDDWLRPGAIAAVSREVRRHVPDLIGCDYRKRRIHKLAFSGPYGRLLTDRDRIAGGICASRKMYAWIRISRRDLWAQGLRFPEGRVFEDAAVTPWLGLQARSYVHIGRALVQYRIRADSILSGITRTPGRFNVDKHRDLARALTGFAAALDREKEPFPRTRLAASHFVAMEFAKIARRIERAGPQGTGVADTMALIREFREIMEPTSPIPFSDLLRRYLGRGRFIAWHQLRKALALSERQGRVMAA
ncbi:glycosyltransferase family 2 protein [Altererythrobacter sp. H2]|uniref:glycosyltransferase family 2 protein n=1 Tax=Altererythrobacter sp. H2 TaxID=3108391 RepID=UPI002B4BF82E|nr:glycosyltransferase family 2 protein [Altererythrobacter sp. H2]WRK94743.1 glycosyltransferase family 2 protein [Altererythrobacter sp. H2]